ncbi:MAG: hypothetical protein K6F03_00370 [Saccharofermentans sp.]|nr:hypothetical protein [Saccharofermentans sp.]
MSTDKINIKTVIAVLLLIVDVLAIRWSVDAITENKMHHYMAITGHYSGMQLTLNKDITGTVHGKIITVPSGTVVTTDLITDTNVYFSYSDERMIRAYEDFKEQDQLEKIKQEIEEVEQKNNAERQRIINENRGYGITKILCGLLIGSIITFILVKLKWCALLYVIDIVFIFLLFNVTISSMCR